jgi:hypothetical protein
VTGALSPAAIGDRLELHRRRAWLRDGYRAALAGATRRHQSDSGAAQAVDPEPGLAAIDGAMDQLAIVHSPAEGPLPRGFNPYGQLVAALAQGCSAEVRAEILSELRPALTTSFAYAVPSDGALDSIAALGDELLEIGAGGGYWARCLSARGLAVHAFDRLAPLAQRRKAGSLAPHFPIIIGGPAEALTAFPRCPTLLLCWPPGISNSHQADAGAPPRFSPMGEQALAGFKGRRLVFVGSRSDSFGSPAFFARLDREWDLVDELPLPNLGRWRDRVFIYSRR